MLMQRALRGTNPSRFELKVLFNSQFDDPNDKSRAPNSLVKMIMDYDGTMRDFPVVMNNVRELRQILHPLTQIMICEVRYQARYF